MKISLVTLICLCLLFTSCQEDEPLDLEGLEWLQAEIADIQQSSLAEYFYINEAEYKRDRVFIIENCCPFCSTVVSVYSEEGELLGYIGDSIATDQLKDQRLFWQPEDAACFQ
ncbi:MAG: hypothetical protein RIF33_20555 [Cyclobacteriaceae bacterium]